MSLCRTLQNCKTLIPPCLNQVSCSVRFWSGLVCYVTSRCVMLCYCCCCYYRCFVLFLFLFYFWSHRVQIAINNNNKKIRIILIYNNKVVASEHRHEKHFYIFDFAQARPKVLSFDVVTVDLAFLGRSWRLASGLLYVCK